MPAKRSYTGASGRITRDRIGKLDDRWVIQPKLDGIYAEAHTDALGRISRVLSRKGKEWSTELVGTYAGVPEAILCGELEDMTEWAEQTVAEHGYQRLHLFDCLRWNGLDLSDRPYRERRDCLLRAQDTARSHDDGDMLDGHGRAHYADTGRFKRKIPPAWQLLPVVPQWRPRHVQAVWADEVWRGNAEGLVAVNLLAKPGQRGAKKKCKEAETIDALVESVGGGVAVLRGSSGIFTVSCAGQFVPLPGTWVEVAIEGRYVSGQPRFARLIRPRADLCAKVKSSHAKIS